MTDEKQVPGVPDGWRLVAIRSPIKGEWVIGIDGQPHETKYDDYHEVIPVIERAPKPKRRVLVSENYLNESRPYFMRWAEEMALTCPDKYRIEYRDA